VEVVDRGAIGVDAQGVVERGKDFLEMHRAVFGFAAQSIGRANCLTGTHASARQQRA
jgi:hypothetical protein